MLDFDAKFKIRNYSAGDIVVARTAYKGGGHFACDGDEGVYTVLKPFKGGPDYYLVRGVWTPEQLADLSWDIIMHAQRLRPLIPCSVGCAAPSYCDRCEGEGNENA